MKITVLDKATLGEDLDMSPLEAIGETIIYQNTKPEEVSERLMDTDVVVINKIPLNENTIGPAPKLRLICIAATGFDNIDTVYARKRGITVCNVAGYSTNSVAQVTVATVLELATHIRAYTESVCQGLYTKSGVQNRLVPVYHEIAGMTWGVIGAGNIGGKVADIAQAFGCNVIVYKRHEGGKYPVVSLDELLQKSDIITIHTPLNNESRGLIGGKELKKMKKNAILVNEGRGAVLVEKDVAEAVKAGTIGAFGCDVYSKEPFPEEHPYTEIANLPNVCLTPHMAWGAYEARERCLKEIVKNIESYYSLTPRNVVN